MALIKKKNREKSKESQEIKDLELKKVRGKYDNQSTIHAVDKDGIIVHVTPIILRKLELKAKDRIRKRRSYMDNKKRAELLFEQGLNGKQVKFVITMIDGIIDEKQGYHSQRNSDAATESIQLLIEDMQL